MEKVYVDDTNHATITCPKCKLEKNLDVTDFKDSHKKPNLHHNTGQHIYCIQLNKIVKTLKLLTSGK